ncbi:hypothetical protein TESG_04228 [Trichophyton tonsurans CBS 112818]|uniref:F-box domain-containing protein n=2 Tax=Trichophyton TaxID=5550 RepID=F2Q166_TRIEC|nr:hypothetical protein TESG_04228 [Trichophyton tonsurans CBS 112818]EGE07884.1 F-box domain-containing protein [Trichophyton equinum CBS 127.97]
MADIHSLPVEILYLILSFISASPPPTADERALRDLPSHAVTSSRTTDLKSVSRVCRQFREFSREHLFSCCRYELRDQDRFLAFISRHGLAEHVESVAVSVRSIFPGSEKQLWWKTLFAALNPTTVTVVAPPFMIADMAQCALQGDKWAFDMPLQTIQFRQQKQQQQQQRDQQPDTQMAIPAAEGESSSSSSSSSSDDDSFLTAKPWTQLLFNEGSSLQAYSVEDYFRLRPPSIINHWGSVDPLQAVNLPYPASAISRLTSFRYIAVFPFYSHTNLVLKLFRSMTNLRSLALQLSPPEWSDIFEKEQKNSTMDPENAWMELETGYSLVPHSVRYLGVHGRLVEFRALDYNLPPQRSYVFRTMHQVLNLAWQHDGHGRWVKRPAASNTPG